MHWLIFTNSFKKVGRYKIGKTSWSTVYLHFTEITFLLEKIKTKFLQKCIKFRQEFDTFV